MSQSQGRISADPEDVTDFDDGYAFGVDDGYAGARPYVGPDATIGWMYGYYDGYGDGEREYLKDYPEGDAGGW